MFEWYWWVVFGVVLLLFVWRWVLPVHNHPSTVLGRQASSMGWIAAGTSKDAKGYRNLRVSKGGVQAVISFEDGHVLLVHPPVAQPFKDFVELEEYLQRPKAPVTAAPSLTPARRSEADIEEASDYHTDLDKMAEDCAGFIADNALQADDDWPTELHAEAIVYLACFNAKLGHRHQFSAAGWNTFKASVENRMMEFKSIEPPKNDAPTKSLVSYTSGYHSYLSQREKLARPAHEGSHELADQLLRDIGGPEGANEQWRTYFRGLVARGSKDVLFKVWLSFER